MKETERKEMTKKLKTIIENSINDLPTGELLALINLSARSDLYFKSNIKNKDVANIEIEINEVIKKYIKFLM